MNSEDSASRHFAWGPWIGVAFGGLLFLMGAERFVLRHRFGFMDALYCLLAVVPAGFLLLVFDYVSHHARLVAVILLIFAGMLVISFPVFDVALGLTLMGALGGSALGDWKNEKRGRKSATTQGDENLKRK